ncbi:MAG TPA: hypothetical protein VGJ26_09945 [Pirellulales bacterium]
MDYDVQRCTRHCAATGRELREGEECYSALMAEGAELRRLDYSVEAWQGPPEGALGWWKSRVPTREVKKNRLAPNEVLLECFVALEGVADKQDMRLVLALLLVRRRVLKLEQRETDEQGRELLVLFNAKDETTHRVTGVMPSPERANEIQNEISQLLPT